MHNPRRLATHLAYMLVARQDTGPNRFPEVACQVRLVIALASFDRRLRRHSPASRPAQNLRHYPVSINLNWTEANRTFLLTSRKLAEASEAVCFVLPHRIALCLSPLMPILSGGCVPTPCGVGSGCPYLEGAWRPSPVFGSGIRGFHPTRRTGGITQWESSTDHSGRVSNAHLSSSVRQAATGPPLPLFVFGGATQPIPAGPLGRTRFANRGILATWTGRATSFNHFPQWCPVSLPQSV